MPRTKDISTSGLEATNGRHLEIATSGYVGHIYHSAIDFLDTENMGDAAGISLISCPETEI